MIKNIESNSNNVLIKENNSSQFEQKSKESVKLPTTELYAQVQVIRWTWKYSYLVSALVSSFPGEADKVDILKKIH